MLATIANKIREHGLVWCIKRSIREFWHPRFSIIQRIEPVNRLIYWPFAQIGKIIDYATVFGIYPNDRTVYVFYDLEISPITYDYVWALALGEYQRQKLQLDAVHIVIVPGVTDGLRKEAADYELVIDQAARQWRIYNMLVPLVALLPKCGFTVCNNRQQATLLKTKCQHYIPNQYSCTLPNTHVFKDELQKIVDLKLLRAPAHGIEHLKKWQKKFCDGKKLISITIRQYEYMTDRNSNLAEWRKFIDALDRNVYAIVIVPDLEQAWEESNRLFSDCHYFVPATWNLHLRAALYETCYINLGVNSGPQSLCWLNAQCNYITFKMQASDVPQTSERFLTWLGFTMGESLPFANATQKWVWEPDNAEVITREFSLMCQRIEEINT